jgi:hypothetical protein
MVLSGHGSLIRTRLDPIVNPEEVSGHVHSVIGSSAFTANMDFTSAREGDVSDLVKGTHRVTAYYLVVHHLLYPS